MVLLNPLALLDVDEAACAPRGCTPEGFASVIGPALEAAKGPIHPWDKTPITIA